MELMSSATIIPKTCPTWKTSMRPSLGSRCDDLAQWSEKNVTLTSYLGKAIPLSPISFQGPQRRLHPPRDRLVLLHQPLVQESGVCHWKAHCKQASSRTSWLHAQGCGAFGFIDVQRTRGSNGEELKMFVTTLTSSMSELNCTHLSALLRIAWSITGLSACTGLAMGASMTMNTVTTHFVPLSFLEKISSNLLMCLHRLLLKKRLQINHIHMFIEHFFIYAVRYAHAHMRQTHHQCACRSSVGQHTIQTCLRCLQRMMADRLSPMRSSRRPKVWGWGHA